jgi:hypothetical protein
MATNARRKMIRDNHLEEEKGLRRLQMQKEHQAYLAEREKRLQAFEQQLRAAQSLG